MYRYTVRPRLLYRYVLLLVFNHSQPLLPPAYMPCPTPMQVVLCLCPIEPSDAQRASTHLAIAGTGDNPHRTLLQLPWLPALAQGSKRDACGVGNEAALHAHHKVATLGDCQVPAHVTCRSE